MFRKIFSRKNLYLILALILLDILAVGLGMGVPFFAILFGFIVGWIAPGKLAPGVSNLSQLLKESLLVAIFAAAITFLCMLIIWGPFSRMLLDPSADFVEFGIPMILYQPKASFIGWMLLMIFASPVLQLLAANFSTMVRIILRMPGLRKEDQAPGQPANVATNRI